MRPLVVSELDAVLRIASRIDVYDQDVAYIAEEGVKVFGVHRRHVHLLLDLRHRGYIASQHRLDSRADRVR